MQPDTDFQELFSTELGGRVLRHLMVAFNVWKAHDHPTDPNTLSFMEGRRDAVLYILHKATETKDRDAFAAYLRDQFAATGYDSPPHNPTPNDSSVARFLGDP